MDNFPVPKGEGAEQFLIDSINYWESYYFLTFLAGIFFIALAILFTFLLIIRQNNLTARIVLGVLSSCTFLWGLYTTASAIINLSMMQQNWLLWLLFNT
jgi:hypothetical protein